MNMYMLQYVFLFQFSQDLFMTMYSEFVQHYSQARTTLETAKQNKASLTKALEVSIYIHCV